MAKRRLNPPSADELSKLDAAFRNETPTRPNPATAPISQVAAETAAAGSGETTQAKMDRLAAERLKEAEDNGLLITEIPLSKIDTETLVRDRSVLDKAELDELISSISISGLRLPIEVYEANGGYVLISGYRRLMAYQNLNKRFAGEFDTIRAIIRPQTDIATSFRNMVEENEIRSSLSHFERGRIAVLSTRQGAFKSVEDAVRGLFLHASKSKRSKVRSFADVFELLGDVLTFPERLSERQGLRLAGALRQGAEDALREALDTGQGVTPETEWAALELVITQIETGPVRVAKQGRPKAAPAIGWAGKDTLHLSTGMTLIKGHDSEGYFIRLKGRAIDANSIEIAMGELQRLFERG